MIKTFLKILLIAVIVALGYVGWTLATTYRTIVIDSNERSGGIKGIFCLFKVCADDKITIVNDPFPIPEEDPNRSNFLILGIRGEDDLSHGGLLTDTMILLSIDKTTGRAALISIPRDLSIDLDGTLVDGKVIHIKGKINEVYAHGYANQQGLTFTSQILSRLTGVYVNKAVLFDFKAFGTIVDALGGVDIHLDKPFSEKQQWGFDFSLPAGDNHLNGDQALLYVRSRYSSSDFDRARRQQQVMFAIKKKATTLGFLANPVKISGLIASLKGNLRTNIQIWEVGDLLNLASKLKTTDLKTTVISTDNLLEESHAPGGEYILMPKGGNFALLKDFIKGVLLE